MTFLIAIALTNMGSSDCVKKRNKTLTDILIKGRATKAKSLNLLSHYITIIT